MNKEGNSSNPRIDGNEEDFNDFYRLHYPQKQRKSSPISHFRAKSVLSVTEK